MGTKSILSKKSVEEAIKHSEEAKRLFIKVSYERLGRLSKVLSLQKDKLNYGIAFIMLEKSVHTFQEINTLLKKANYEESFVLLRLLLERAALIFTMLKDDLSFEEILKIKVKKCMRDLKTATVDFGPLYGLFSKIAHSKIAFFVLIYRGSRNRKLFKSLKDRKIYLLMNFFCMMVGSITYAVLEFLDKEYFNIKSWKRINNKCWTYDASFMEFFHDELLSLDLNEVFVAFFRDKK